MDYLPDKNVILSPYNYYFRNGEAEAGHLKSC